MIPLSRREYELSGALSLALCIIAVYSFISTADSFSQKAITFFTILILLGHAVFSLSASVRWGKGSYLHITDLPFANPLFQKIKTTKKSVKQGLLSLVAGWILYRLSENTQDVTFRDWFSQSEDKVGSDRLTDGIISDIVSLSGVIILVALAILYTQHVLDSPSFEYEVINEVVKSLSEFALWINISGGGYFTAVGSLLLAYASAGAAVREYQHSRGTNRSEGMTIRAARGFTRQMVGAFFLLLGYLTPGIAAVIRAVFSQSSIIAEQGLVLIASGIILAVFGVPIVQYSLLLTQWLFLLVLFPLGIIFVYNSFPSIQAELHSLPIDPLMKAWAILLTGVILTQLAATRERFEIAGDA